MDSNFVLHRGRTERREGRELFFYIVIMFIINIVVIWGLAIAGAVHFRTLRLSCIVGNSFLWLSPAMSDGCLVVRLVVEKRFVETFMNGGNELFVFFFYGVNL